MTGSPVLAQVRAPAAVEATMSDMFMAETNVKALFKEAVVEALQERQDWLYDLFMEVLEDFALVKAIQEGESDERVSREEVFLYLERAT